MPKPKPLSVTAASENRSPASPRTNLPGHFTPSSAAIRETVESLVIAFVLAFLFRTFEAEMFVIPTGSMAPTLMGRHKDLYCPKCGYNYRANAASEVDQNSGELKAQSSVGVATCPMCRYTARLDFDIPSGESRSYNGDRIVVNKLAYELGDPQRWDVAVFKFPGLAKQNYIKRVVGLPSETVRLQYGDVFTKRPEQAEFHIARKPPLKILAVLQAVYDNDYVCKPLVDGGWPLRWQALTAKAPGAWRETADHRSFSVDGVAPGEVWLRYQHFVPSGEQWRQILERGRAEVPAEPLLITDFSAYNSSAERSSDGLRPVTMGQNWVGDLALECELQTGETSGEVRLELRKGGRKFTCRFDLAAGTAQLGIDTRSEFHPTAKSVLAGPGRYRVRFSNIDQELLLWVNGRVVAFDAPTTYGELGNHRPQLDDLSPVGIAARQAAVEVRHLRIWRDLYYIPAGARVTQGGADPEVAVQRADDVLQAHADPRLWEQFGGRAMVDFPLEKGQFLVLGDNSACSKDSRLWEGDGTEYYVRRDLLIGRALFVFWPHSWDRIDIGSWAIPFPYFPNFSRMKFVR